jgi:hypothetical protein
MLGHTLLHDAAVDNMDIGELGVGQIDPRAVLGPSYRVPDRLIRCLDDPGPTN